MSYAGGVRVACLLGILFVACGGRTPIEGDVGAGGGGSSGSSGSGGGTPSAYCDIVTGGAHVCTGYSNVPASQATALDSQCQQQGDAVVNGCPGTSELGCCVLSESPYVVSVCFYCPGDPAMIQMTCSGKWVEPNGGPAPCGG